MAVTFWCPSSGAAPISPSDHSSWGASGSGFSRKKAVTTRGSTAMTDVNSGEASQTSDRSGYQWVYGPLNGATISGTVEFRVRGRADTFVNLYQATAAIWIAKPDATLRATLLSASTLTHGSIWGTTDANYVVNGSISSGTATAGDYLVMEVGTVNNSGFIDVDSFYVEIGDTSSTNGMYFEFSDNDIAFWAPAGLTYSAMSSRVKVNKVVTNNTPSSTGGPIASYAVQTGALPTGLTLNTSTGVISGTPTVPGTYTLTVRATNEGGTTDSASISYVVYRLGNTLKLNEFSSGRLDIG